MPTLRFILLLALLSGPGAAQDLEPRRWTPLPVGMNVAGAGVLYTDGDISFDPVLEIEDATVESKTAVISYLRAFDLLGKSARFDVRLPFTDARWEGLLAGQAASTERHGMSDPRIRLSVNFIGAPALSGKDYQAFRTAHTTNTTVGAALAVTLPLGEYKQHKLLNLGQNRFIFRPQLGVVHVHGSWSWELTGSMFLYQDNDEFFGNNKREQDPLYTLQGHVVYTAPQHWWISVGAAHDRGGESSINGDNKDDKKSDLLYGLSAGLPVGSRFNLKAAYFARRTSKDVGAETDNYILAFSARF